MSFTASVKKSKCFALIDCNNFYASCEKLFRPDLTYKPVVVASNNDGCVIARSAEAKALGIKMGVPLFQIQDVIRHHAVQVFSSNFALYADISHRVMSTIEAEVPRLEVYSIDEAFADLTGLSSAIQLEVFGSNLLQKIDKWVGIKTCVGIAPTKTLAKLANYGAKKYPKTGGVVDLTSPVRQRKLMAITPVEEVWGVGRRISQRLEFMNIRTALQLADASPTQIRREFSIVLERTARELRGESCLTLEEIPPTKKQIVVSRSFGERVETLNGLSSAIDSFVARGVEKLRGENRSARHLTIYIRTSSFGKHEAQYSNSASHAFAVPSQDTRDFLEAASTLISKVYLPGFKYAKAGIMLTDFYEPGVYQPSLFDKQATKPKSKALMEVIDKLNTQKNGSVYFASQAQNQSWLMRRKYLSPAYTTRWDEIPIAR